MLRIDEAERLAGFKADWATVLDHFSRPHFFPLTPYAPRFPPMKLKQLPDDFFVEEVTEVSRADKGPLRCTAWRNAAGPRPTPCRPCAGAGGSKPDASPTAGSRTATPGPSRSHHPPRPGPRPPPPRRHGDASRLDRRPVHVARHPLQPLPADVRDLTPGGGPRRARPGTRAVESMPNYFDDQRFGSVAGEGQEFIARLLVRGRFEDALHCVTAPHEFDRGPQKKEKASCARAGAIGRVEGAAAARPRPQPGRLPARPPRRLPRRRGPAAAGAARPVPVGVPEPFMEPDAGAVADGTASAGTAAAGRSAAG